MPSPPAADVSLELGLAAHSRMLEIGESDSAAAITHALEGARIFQALRQQNPVQPDWVSVHEEQCCRSGAIWIHRLALGDPQATAMARDGLKLLARLEELHLEPIAWLAAMRADLIRIGEHVDRTASGSLADVLHLHGFKCAGSTFIWSLEHASRGSVAYVESEASNQRLAWERVRDHFATAPAHPQLITSHLITLPPPGALARLKVAFLRDPLARLASAYRFELHLQGTIAAMSFRQYIEHYCRGLLANFQTRHLSPQDPDNWRLQQGWAARPELIDLERQDLFVGLVERYDESIVALEHALERLGCPLDLAYPQRMNTTDGIDVDVDPTTSAPAERLLEITELDANLYRRATARLDARLAVIPDLTGRLAAFAERCAALRENQPAVELKPGDQWTILGAEGMLGTIREGS
ncbi:hypothetical protein KBZ19_05380 [Synechococcus sp. L2F]|uniref:sulfotransferase family protein n=1 Tax=Synechococcus sp. L2F TaxID=2823739 RepID=UPI0020CFA692|nr:sulfotransferase family protein [Synechococcus sp. L2F]MCP9827914.1 hypothetical protein [Synechococcus sp. L2F]